MHRTREIAVVAAGIALTAGAGIAAALAAPPPPAAGPGPTPQQLRFFETRVRPVLAERCYSCHGPARQVSNLRLDSRAAVLKGGASGPAVVPGSPAQSLLVKAVRHDGRQMPPGGKLAAAEIEALAEWVKLGAPWPEAGANRPGGGPDADFRNPRSAAARAYWAFQPLRRPPVPAVPAAWPGPRPGARKEEWKNGGKEASGPALPFLHSSILPFLPRSWARNPIDAFVLARLRREGLTPAPEADPRTLIRRVTFDLTGLPPTPEEVEAFVAECESEQLKGRKEETKKGSGRSGSSVPPFVHSSIRSVPDQVYAKLVDRLLASPRYGERQARAWLDLVRYADSDGYRIDDYRPHAWRYRDYVIQSFNEDKPYDRFVQEQLAGDELFPGDPEALVATGYLRHWIYEYNNRDVRGQWTIILDDVTDTTGDVFLGMGIQCARCHDHKFDPILQRDYYRLQAFFAPLLPREDLAAARPQQEADHRARLAAWEAKTADLRSRIDSLEARWREAAAESAIIKFPPDIQALIRKPVAERAPLEHQLAELAYRQVTYEYGRLETHVKGEDKEQLLALRKQLAAFEKEKPEPLPVAFAVTDVGPKAPPVYIPKREDEPIEPGFPTVLDPKPARITPLPGAPNSTGRRAALARWLTRPDNPLTARVMVNRVWQQHFGRGLAANPSDFGRLGERPTHPELLDWLAFGFANGRMEERRKGRSRPIPDPLQGPNSSIRPFVRSSIQSGNRRWSLKALHRLIVTSATYRQSSLVAPAPRTGGGAGDPGRSSSIDPENRLYARWQPRRLDAEQIRDAMLAVTGELDLKAGGPGVIASEPRRTVYTRYMRNTRDPLLDVFDLPIFFASAATRDTTTTPVQSLLLFNSQPLLRRAQALAERLERETGAAHTGRTPGSDPAAAIERAYRLIYGRAPAVDEARAAAGFLAEQSARIDPAQAGSEQATFLHDRIPYRDGQAAVMSPEGPQRRFAVTADAKLPAGDFTIEAFVLPRSVYDSGAVRTIAARWDGDVRAPGWAFGITGKQSRRKPQTLVLQLVGQRLDGSVGEEALFSDHHIAINKPYYVAAAVRLAARGQAGAVTFFVKDLSNDDEPLLTAEVPHPVTGGLANALPLTLGGRGGEREADFDGLLDDVRLSHGALPLGQLLFTAEGVLRQTAGYWRFEAKPDVFHDASGNGLDIRPAARARATVDPRRAALVDFCHALLNSSEFLYVD